MNITLFPLGSYNAGILKPFTIELDDLDEDGYRAAIAQGLWDNSTLTGSNVTSTRCNACGHITIANEHSTCEECSSEDLNYKRTEEEWIVCDYEGIPKTFVGEYDLDPDFWEFKELPDSTSLDADVIEAGLDCGIELENIEEAYSGTYECDKDFAHQLADETGAIDHTATWPMTCIDWEYAARELMYDYCEASGHYFRIM